MQQQMAGEPEPIMKWLVDKHNELRARHGVQPMVWDWGLAWNAYNYVLNCPNGHSGKPGIGENPACKQQQRREEFANFSKACSSGTLGMYVGCWGAASSLAPKIVMRMVACHVCKGELTAC